MAQAAPRARRGLVGLMRCGIRRQGGKIFSSPKLFESSHISPSHPKAFSSSSVSRGASSSSSSSSVAQQQLDRVNNSSSGGHYSLLSNVAKAYRGISFRAKSFSSQGDVKTLAARELITGYRSALQRSGLQRQGVDSRLQQRPMLPSYHLTKAKREVSLLVKEGSGGGASRGRRAYHVDNQGMQHFKRRGPASWAEKFATQRSMGMVVVLVGGGLVVYVTNLQTVPYTHRKHFMLVSPNLERSIGDRTFQMVRRSKWSKG